MKRKIDYAFSATGYCSLPTNEILEEFPDHELFSRYSLAFDRARELSKDLKHIDAHYSFLANGFNEKARIEYFRKMNLGQDHVYVDSGGLQMANLGMNITEQDKLDVYKVQAKGTYGFCFDEIPLFVDKSYGVSTKNTRSTVEDKIFIHTQLKEYAEKTGVNINNQCRILQDLGTDTKVIVIIQGNIIDDMYDFFNYTLSKIDPENYSRISGVAVADTCMGNGVLESCDMIASWRKIYEAGAPDFFSNHIHLLGVGALNRFYPFISAMKSNMIPEHTFVSADSSKHSMSYQMGQYNGANGTVKYGQERTSHSDALFAKVYDDFEDLISDYYTKDEYINFFSSRVGSFEQQRTDSYSISNDMGLFCRFNNFLHILSSVADMFSGFDNIIDGKKSLTNRNLYFIKFMQQCKTFDDYLHLRSQIARYVQSKRINRHHTRESLLSNLEEFY